MKRNRRVFLASIGSLWWIMSSMALAADPLKVGVMDQQLVIEKSKAGKRALEELKA
jgi:outer membrane protein